MGDGQRIEWRGWLGLRPRSSVAQGLPADAERLCEPRELLAPHRTALEALRLESGCGAEQFSQLFELVLLALADYLYLLPATRAENHNDPGGLLRLAIEGAVLAFRRAEGQFLTGPVHTDVRNRERDRIWRYAIFLGALFRPVGRCCTSVRVVSKDGEGVWFPHVEGLWSWLRRENVRAFGVEWRDSTDMRPDQACSIWLLGRLLPQPALHYLSLAGERVMEALVQMTVGAGVGRVCEIVEEAQQAAIDRDLSQVARRRAASPSGIPLEHRLLDAIRSLIREKWTLNTPGGRLWVTHQGVYLAWKAAVTDIAVKLRADGLCGVPRDPDTLAEVLLARGVLVPNSVSTSTLKHYYRITPLMRGVPKQSIEVVKFADAEMVGLAAKSVEPVELELTVPQTTVANSPMTATAGTKAGPGRTTRSIPTNSTKSAATSKGSLELPFTTPPTPEPELKPTSISTEMVRPAPEGGVRGPHNADPVTRADPSASTTSINGRSVDTPAEVENPDPQLSASHPGLTRLAQFGAAGPTLRALGERLLSEPHLAGVVSTPEGVVIAYPNAIAAFCQEPQQFLSSCESQGLLVADKAAAGRLVRKRSSDVTLPEQYIVLSPRVARYLLLRPVTASHGVDAN